MKKVSDILYELRAKTGESQEVVASSCGIARVTYTRYENGQRIPTATNARKLAKHFNVTVEYLYAGDESELNITASAGTDEQFHITDHEKALLIEYRKSNSYIQQAVCDILHVQSDQAQQTVAKMA